MVLMPQSLSIFNIENCGGNCVTFAQSHLATMLWRSDTRASQ
jgi:hypothetical protein